MTESPNPLDELFAKGMRRMSNREVRNWAFKHGLLMDQVQRHVWIDDAGHAWSFLSRVGYFHAMRDPERTGSSLLELALSDFNARYSYSNPLSIQTQPGEPDVLWAWLGSLSFAPNAEHGRLKDSMQQALSLAPKVNAEDGSLGWVGEALVFGKRVAEATPTRPHMHRWINALVGQNLLSMPSYFTAWTGNPPAYPNWSSWNDELLHEKMDYPVIAHERNEKIWTLLMGWAVALIQNDPALSVKTKLEVRSEPRTLSAGLGPVALEALKGYVRAGGLERLDQPVHGGAVEATKLIVAYGDRFAPSEEALLVERLLDRTFVRDPGEPEGSLWDWHGVDQIPAMNAWAKEVQLDSSLPKPSAKAPKPRF
jgi:hypothetical protein